MKLRIRIRNYTKTINFSDGSTKDISLGLLRQRLKSEFGLEIPFDLSLNKTDALSGEETVLDEFGIVSGDLIHVLVEDEEEEETHQYREPENRRENIHNDLHEGASNRREDDESVKMDTDCGQPSTSTSVEKLTSDPYTENVKDDPVVNRCLREPMQCYESTDNEVPATLSNLFRTVNSPNQQDLLWVVIHTLTLESGLTPIQGGDLCSMPVNWKQTGFYNIRYRLPESGNVVCSMTGVIMGSFLVVHGVLVGPDEVESSSYHCNIRTAEFVTDHTQDGAARSYQNLPQLSRVFKNQICLPLIRDMRSELGYPSGNNFLSLTHELKLKILVYLDVASLLRLDRTCQHFHCLARDKLLWRKRYLLDFGSRSDNNLAQDWYEMYKCQFVARRAHRKALRNMTILTPGQVWMQPRPHPPFAPVAPYNGGILGGEYDLNPQFQGIPDPFGRRRGNPLNPVRPRIDPFGPLPDQNIFHGPRRGGRGGGWMGGFGGPRWF